MIFLNYFVLNTYDNTNSNTIWLRSTDYQLYGKQISDTFSEDSAGILNQELIESEGIKYSELILNWIKRLMLMSTIVLISLVVIYQY